MHNNTWFLFRFTLIITHCGEFSALDTWNSPARPPLKAQGSWSPLRNCAEDWLRHPVRSTAKRKLLPQDGGSLTQMIAGLGLGRWRGRVIGVYYYPNKKCETIIFFFSNKCKKSKLYTTQMLLSSTVGDWATKAYVSTTFNLCNSN